MARTDAERLEFYLELRDTLDDALAGGVPKVRYRIGNTEVEREPTTAWLKQVEEIISRLTAATNVSRGRHRNLIRFQR